MSSGNYITINGTFYDPIGSSNDIPNIDINIETLNYSMYSPFPRTKIIKVNNLSYNFQLLKGCQYKVTILSSFPNNTSTNKKGNIEFYLDIPLSVDETQEYDLYEYMVTNFAPLIQSNTNEYASFIYQGENYVLKCDNNSLIIKKGDLPVQYHICDLSRMGGILNNSSFEYPLVDEDYGFEVLDLSGTAVVTTTYNGDISYPDSDLYTEVDTLSLDLDITNSGATIDDIILTQKMKSLKANQDYRLRFWYKLVSGTPTGDATISISNTNEELILFDNLEFTEDSNGWNLYDCVATCMDETETYSSVNYHFNIKLGGVGVIRIRLDQMLLEEYYE